MANEKPKFSMLKFFGYSNYTNSASRPYERKTEVSMFVPGINSGMYDKALAIHVVIKRRTIFGLKKVSFGEVVLFPAEVKQLKEECEKILSL